MPSWSCTAAQTAPTREEPNARPSSSTASTPMKERGIDPRRLRLTAICTVCIKPFLKEVNQMNDLLREIGSVRGELAAVPQAA